MGGGGAMIASATAASMSDTPDTPLARPADSPSRLRTFHDFGAKGDFDINTGQGTDDTRAIQAAIDWAHGDGQQAARALVMLDGNYLCGPITTYPYTTIIGSGRHTSNLICHPATRGVWWGDRGKGAQKLMLSGIAWYGRGNAGLSHVASFGDKGIQFGTEGIMQGLWVRDAPKAVGLLVNGNVGIVRDITARALDTGVRMAGNANQVENIIAMECRHGVDLRGSFVRGLHIEAIDNNGVPLTMTGDCRVSDVCFSLAKDTQFDHLVTIDDSTYREWSLMGVQVFARNAQVRRSVLKIGSTLRGGTDLAAFSGSNHLGRLTLHYAQ